MYLFALEVAGILKSKLGNACGTFFRNDLYALNHAGNNFMFNANVFAFSVLANDDEVHAGIPGGNSGKILDRAEVCEQLVLLAQRYVNAGESATDGSGDGAF